MPRASRGRQRVLDADHPGRVGDAIARRGRRGGAAGGDDAPRLGPRRGVGPEEHGLDWLGAARPQRQSRAGAGGRRLGPHGQLGLDQDLVVGGAGCNSRCVMSHGPRAAPSRTRSSRYVAEQCPPPAPPPPRTAMSGRPAEPERLSAVCRGPWSRRV